VFGVGCPDMRKSGSEDAAVGLSLVAPTSESGREEDGKEEDGKEEELVDGLERAFSSCGVDTNTELRIDRTNPAGDALRPPEAIIAVTQQTAARRLEFSMKICQYGGKSSCIKKKSKVEKRKKKLPKAFLVVLREPRGLCLVFNS